MNISIWSICWTNRVNKKKKKRWADAVYWPCNLNIDWSGKGRKSKDKLSREKKNTHNKLDIFLELLNFQAVKQPTSCFELGSVSTQQQKNWTALLCMIEQHSHLLLQLKLEASSCKLRTIHAWQPDNFVLALWRGRKRRACNASLSLISEEPQRGVEKFRGVLCRDSDRGCASAERSVWPSLLLSPLRFN